MFNTIEEGLAALKAGKMVILLDDDSRENEGDLILAAEKVTPEAINFMCREARGLICLSLTQEDFARLDIPLMTKNNRSPHNTAFGVSFEAAKGVTTGISAGDRARTISVAIDENSTASDIIMPGHIFPLRAVAGGVLERRGHTESSVDLARLAGFKPAAVICEIMNDDGSMARQINLEKFARQHNLCLLRIKDLVDYRLRHESLITEIAKSSIPVKSLGQFDCHVFKAPFDKSEHLALVRPSKNIPLVRLHSECLTGDVFGSKRCDCGAQLELSLELIAKHGGALLYLRQEGRGIGLANKIKAYDLQDQGMDTVEANLHLGFRADERNYATAAQMLKALGLRSIKLLTNNPKKIDELKRYGIENIEHEKLPCQANAHNIRYLRTKQQKLGHLLDIL